MLPVFFLCDRAVMGTLNAVNSVRQFDCSLIRFLESCSRACACDRDCSYAFFFCLVLCLCISVLVELCSSRCSPSVGRSCPSLLSVVRACLLARVQVKVICDSCSPLPSPRLFPSLSPVSTLSKKRASVPCPGLQAVRSQNWTPGCLPGVGPL